MKSFETFRFRALTPRSVSVLFTFVLALACIAPSHSGYKCQYVDDVDCMQFFDTCLQIPQNYCSADICAVITQPAAAWYCWPCYPSYGCLCHSWGEVNFIGYVGNGWFNESEGCRWGTACNAGECFCLYGGGSQTATLYYCDPGT